MRVSTLGYRMGEILTLAAIFLLAAESAGLTRQTPAFATDLGFVGLVVMSFAVVVGPTVNSLYRSLVVEGNPE